MATKVKLPDGTEGEFVDEKFDTIKEDWNEYRLADGTVVRFKVIVTSVGRVINSDGEITYNPEGIQNVAVKSTNVVHVINPPENKSTN